MPVYQTDIVGHTEENGTTSRPYMFLFKPGTLKLAKTGALLETWCSEKSKIPLPFFLSTNYISEFCKWTSQLKGHEVSTLSAFLIAMQVHILVMQIHLQKT